MKVISSIVKISHREDTTQRYFAYFYAIIHLPLI